MILGHCAANESDKALVCFAKVIGNYCDANCPVGPT